MITMVEFNPMEQAVLKAMQELGAKNAESIKTADDIAKKCNRPKSMITNTLTSLVQRNAVKRVAREKSAGYYALQS